MSIRFIPVPSGAPGNPPPAAAAVSQEIADSLLETRIRRRLLGLLGRAAFNIGVVASEGMVVLSGFVPAPLHERRALRVTRAVAGVEEVYDLINIKPARGKAHAARPASAGAPQG
jgi:hypothetical protein